MNSYKEVLGDQKGWEQAMLALQELFQTRGAEAKEEAKKFSKAKSAIKMALKTIEMSSSLSDETIAKAHEMIAELESMIESGTAPSEGKVKKLNDLL